MFAPSFWEKTFIKMVGRYPNPIGLCLLSDDIAVGSLYAIGDYTSIGEVSLQRGTFRSNSLFVDLLCCA